MSAIAADVELKISRVNVALEESKKNSVQEKARYYSLLCEDDVCLRSTTWVKNFSR